MWTIRQKQIDAFRKDAVQRFENRMIEHIAKFFPKQSEALGESTVRETIRLGVKQSAEFGIVTERDVCLYIDLMMIFGLDLERSDALPCASRILRDMANNYPANKIDVLYDAALAQLKDQITRERIGG